MRNWQGPAVDDHASNPPPVPDNSANSSTDLAGMTSAADGNPATSADRGAVPAREAPGVTGSSATKDAAPAGTDPAAAAPVGYGRSATSSAPPPAGTTTLAVNNAASVDAGSCKAVPLLSSSSSSCADASAAARLLSAVHEPHDAVANPPLETRKPVVSHSDLRVSRKCGVVFEGLLSGLATLHVQPPDDWLDVFWGRFLCVLLLL